MEKKKARFVNALAHSTEDVMAGRYSYITLTPEAEATVLAEMEGWYILNHSSWRYEYDDYDDTSYGSDIRKTPVTEMISASSGFYSTDDVRGDILVAVGHFAGVAVLTEQTTKSTWSSDRRIAYALLYTDGRVVGDPTSFDSFTGESSSKESESSLSLHKSEA